MNRFKGLLITAALLVFSLPKTFSQTVHTEAILDFLQSWNDKAALNAGELEAAQFMMLLIMNEARLNPNYRHQQGCKTALELPDDLEPLKLDDVLNRIAQEQAVYQAENKICTHDNRNYPKGFGQRINAHGIGGGYEGCGTGSLIDYPIGWMKSESHYRPVWNLDNEIVNRVGFGMAKGSDGIWYFTVVYSYIEPKKENIVIDDPENYEPLQEGLKFHTSRFFGMEGNFEWSKAIYAEKFNHQQIYQLWAHVSFDNPTNKPFDLQSIVYYNGEHLRTTEQKGVTTSGGYGCFILGNEKEKGELKAGTYLVKVVVQGQVVVSDEIVVD